MSDFNVALVVVVCVVTILLLVLNLYILVSFQHPDDYNQAYFPKVIVILGLTLAEVSILLLPADVANRKSCENSLENGSCNLTLPMRELWYTVWIANAAFVFFIIPFTIFFHEGDEDKSKGKRILHALLWCLVTAVVVGALLGLLYGLVGFVDFPVRRLVSATIPITNDFKNLNKDTPCVSLFSVGLNACTGIGAGYGSKTVWTMRVSFIVYTIALCTVGGSLLFMIFGGVGIASLPLSCMFAFFSRPKATITRSEYIKQAAALAQRGSEIRQVAYTLREEERSGKKGWNWRRNLHKLQKEVYQLEEDQALLEEKFPQGEQVDAVWGLTILWYTTKLALGLLGMVVSIAWILHIILYLFIDPPATLFLNDLFIVLDNAWGLLGTLSFALFCFYLLLCVIGGAMYLGLNFFFVTLHPMKLNGTLMSSFLFNVALILACTISIIQFCAKSFAAYAEATMVVEIFGYTLKSLRGLKYLYIFNVFQIGFVALFFIALIVFLVKENRRKKRLKKRLQGGK